MKIIAHRGASAIAPENTLKAVKAALESNADAVEVDIYRNQHELLVSHDKWLQYETNGQGDIQKAPFAYLQTLDAGDGEKIPTLWDVLECIDGKVDINIELKGQNTSSLVLAYIQRACQELNFKENQFLISSFNHHLLRDIKQKKPNIHIGALTSSLPLNYAQFAQDFSAYSVHVDVNFVSNEFVKDAHNRNLKVFAYTVEEQQDIISMIDLGVDGIFTNNPGKTKAFIQANYHAECHQLA